MITQNQYHWATGYAFVFHDLALSISVRTTLHRGFFNCFGCFDLIRIRILCIFRACKATTLKHFNVIDCQIWIEWCVLVRIWQLSVDGWLLISAVLLFKFWGGKFKKLQTYWLTLIAWCFAYGSQIKCESFENIEYTTIKKWIDKMKFQDYFDVTRVVHIDRMA